MKILAVDDEKLALGALESALRRALPEAEIHAFRDSGEALDFARGCFCQVAFLDIQMRGMSGLELAKRLKELHGHTNIVFITGYTEYALDALQMYVSAYLLKPVSPKKILDAMEHLRCPITKAESPKRVRVQCFGNFEVFVDGLPLRFARSRTKELLALLVDRNGAAMNTEQLCAVLWEDDTDIDSQKNKLRHLVSDLMGTLREVNAEDIFLKRRNSFAVVKDRFDCDYYDFRLGLPSGINAYSGEYMSQYSWPELTLGALE